MDESFRLKLAAFLVVYMMMGVATAHFFFTMPIKYAINRDRPKKLQNVKRYLDMRSRERNQPAHPSGDAVLAAYFCGMYYYVFGLPQFFYFLLPIVCLGRV